MRKVRELSSGMLVCAFGVSAALLAWGDIEPLRERESLVGLSGVYLAFEHIDPIVEGLGLTQSAIQTTVELELRKAKIRILTVEESRKTPDKAYLYISINTIARDPGIVAFNVSVSLKQKVQLSNGKEVFASTWDTASVGTVGSDKIDQIRTGGLVQKLEIFANDFLAANPDPPVRNAP